MQAHEYSYSEQKRMKAAYMEFIEDFDPDSFITLVTNDYGSVEGMRALVRDFLGRLDRKMLGNAWLERPQHERTDGVFIIEHVSSNIHAHGLVRMAENDKIDVQEHCKAIWAKLCPGGSVLIEPPRNVQKVASYISKEFAGGRFGDEQIVLARDFMRL